MNAPRRFHRMPRTHQRSRRCTAIRRGTRKSSGNRRHHQVFCGNGRTTTPRVLDQLLDEVLRHAAGRGIHLVTCKVQPLQFAAIHALERHGFLLMDTLLDFFFDFSRTPLEKISPPQRPERIARSIGESGRFA